MSVKKSIFQHPRDLETLKVCVYLLYLVMNLLRRCLLTVYCHVLADTVYCYSMMACIS